MKRLAAILKLSGGVLAAGLLVWCFFSARSCIRERQWLALGPIENHPVRIYDVKIPGYRGRPYEDVLPEYLRAVLGQVLKDIHDKGDACFVKYEKKQNCFHVTVRK